MAGKTGTLAAVFAGAAIGAAIGILFAPEQGTATRRKLKDGYGTRKDGLMNRFNDISGQVKNKFGHSKEDLETGFDRLIANVEEKKDDIITTLEKKLENLKSASAKASSSYNDSSEPVKSVTTNTLAGSAVENDTKSKNI